LHPQMNPPVGGQAQIYTDEGRKNHGAPLAKISNSRAPSNGVVDCDERFALRSTM
jgi:hypothetical protein